MFYENLWNFSHKLLVFNKNLKKNLGNAHNNIENVEKNVERKDKIFFYLFQSIFVYCVGRLWRKR